MENSTLHAMACGFQGSINMINLFCGKCAFFLLKIPLIIIFTAILADRLQRKGVCEYLPRSQQPHYAYSRETLLQHNNSGVVRFDDLKGFSVLIWLYFQTAQISNDADVVKDLLKKIDGVKNMLRELEL